MTLYYQLSLMERALYGVVAILLAVAVIAILVMVCALHMRKRYLLFAIALTVETLFVLQGVMDLYYDKVIYFDFFARIIGNMPCYTVNIVMCFIGISEFTFFIVLWRKKENMLTQGGIKESLDTLPDGVCFFSVDGRPLLVNEQMNRICGELFDTEILNGELFWKQLKGSEEKELQRESRKASVVTVSTRDGSIWKIQRNVLHIGKNEICELVAHDVTEQYGLSQELEERNKKLVQINERLCKYSYEVERITAENEILNAKIQVHDNVGRSLLAFRSYLMQPEEERDREGLLLLWRYTIAVLRKETIHAEDSSDWELLLKAAQAVDVTIMRKGELPKNKKERKIAISALHECLTNTVKHANGSELYCFIHSRNTGMMLELRNNGLPPVETIQETGGLKNLRRIVENAGGSMTIESTPHFVLRVEL